MCREKSLLGPKERKGLAWLVAIARRMRARRFLIHVYEYLD
jgi:hypothetical protein